MFFPDLSKHFNLKILLFVMMEFVTLKKCVNKTRSTVSVNNASSLPVPSRLADQDNIRKKPHSNRCLEKKF